MKLKMKDSILSASVLTAALATILAFLSVSFVTNVKGIVDRRSESTFESNNNSLGEYVTGIAEGYYNQIEKAVNSFDMTINDPSLDAPSNDKPTAENVIKNNLEALYDRFNTNTLNFQGFGFYKEEDFLAVSSSKAPYAYFYDGSQSMIKFDESAGESLNKDRFSGENNKIVVCDKDLILSSYDCEFDSMIFYSIPATITFNAKYIDVLGGYDVDINDEIVGYYFAVADFSIVNSDVSKAFSGYDSYFNLVMSSNGAIYQGTQKSNFRSYVDDSSSEEVTEFLNTLSNNDNATGLFNVNEIPTYISAKTILDGYNGEKLILLSGISAADEADFLSGINKNAVAYVFISCISIIAAYIALFVLSFEMFAKYHKSKFEIKYAKCLALIVKQNGDFLMSNESFEKFNEHGYYTNIKDFKLYNGDERKINDVLNTDKYLLIEHIDDDQQKRIVKFNIIRNLSRYLLVGDYDLDYQIRIDELEKDAYFDNELNVLNRCALVKDLREVLDETVMESYSLILIDIIDFQSMKRIYSYDFTKDVILTVFDMTKDYFKEAKNVYYINGDYIAVLTPRYNQYGMMIEKLKGYHDLFKNPKIIGFNSIKIDIKIGYIDSVSKELPIPNTIQYAILSNQRAKLTEGSYKIFQYDSSLKQFLDEEVVIIEDMKKGITKGEFEVNFQPQYNMQTKKVESFEGLLRWNSPKYINHSPYKYIRLAEEHGLITQLGDIIFTQVFETAKEMIDKGLKDFKVAVNVSPVQFMSSGFVSLLLGYYDKYKVPYNCVSIEITETILLEQSNEVLTKLNTLAEKGIGIHLDDFGTGFSSLMYLNNLPVSHVKLDRSFIIQLEKDAKTRVIVEGIVTICRQLNIQVIAEGVEDDYEFNFLNNIGCYIVQGYGVGKPQPKDKIEEMLEIKVETSSRFKK